VIRDHLTRAWIYRSPLACSLLASLAFGSDPFPVHWRATQDEGIFGSAGDVDGDGMEDVLLGSAMQPSPSSPLQTIVRSGVNGALWLTWTPSLPNTWYFAGGGGVGDLDSDGFGDIATRIGPTAPNSTALEIRSGVDGSVLSILWPPPASSGGTVIGWPTVGAGDLDGDGAPEILTVGRHLVSVPGCMTYGQAVYNFEAPSFGLQYFQTSWQCAQEFGTQLGMLDDVDGDGSRDFYVGASRTDVGGLYDAGWVGVFSGATGALVASLGGTSVQEYLGNSIAALGDVTGDGKPEIAVQHFALTAGNYVTVRSLPSFASVYTITSASIGAFVIRNVYAAGDVDGDGSDDFLARWGDFQGVDHLSAFAGATGAAIGQVGAPTVSVSWGGGLGDVNGDGLGDVFVRSLAPLSSQVHVARNFDLAGPALVGGVAQFQVVAPKRAGRTFQVVFAQPSQDAAVTGIALGPFLFPLMPDELFWASFSAGIGGTLDATGHGSTSVPIPNVPALQGQVVEASGVVYDPAGPLGIGCVLTHLPVEIQ